MNINEIEQYVDLSSARSITIDRSLAKNYPGYVREIVIMKGFLVRLEFNVYDYDCGGLTFYFKYSDYEALILSLEHYLDKKIENWININKTGFYPSIEEHFDIELTGKALLYDFLNDNIILPRDYLEKYLPEGYWKDLYYKINQ